MIVEVADFLVEKDKREAFATAIALGVKNLLSQSKGYISHRIMISRENPERCLLTVEWETLEDHTIGFRQSPRFQKWRELIGPFFKQPPLVEHFEVL